MCDVIAHADACYGCALIAMFDCVSDLRRCFSGIYELLVYVQETYERVSVLRRFYFKIFLKLASQKLEPIKVTKTYEDFFRDILTES